MLDTLLTAGVFSVGKLAKGRNAMAKFTVKVLLNETPDHPFADDEGETLGLNDEQFAYIAQAGRITEIVPGSNVWNMTGVNLD
jgi:hypothetical protein